MSRLCSELSKDKWYKGWEKVQMYLREDQKPILDKNFGAYRFAYNYIMEVYSGRCYFYEMGVISDKPTKFDMQHELVILKHQPGYEWLNEVDAGMLKHAADEAIDAYNENGKHFKSREKFIKSGMESYKARSERTRIENDKIRLPGLKNGDMIQLSFPTGISGDKKIIDPYVYKDTKGNYYVSFITIEDVTPLNKPKTAPIGIDMGTNVMFTTSIRVNGSYYHMMPEEVSRLRTSIARLESAIDKDVNRRKEYAAKHHVDFDSLPKSKRQLKREEKFRACHKRKAHIIDDYENRFILAVVMMNPKWVCMEHFDKKALYRRQKHTDPRMHDLHTYTIRMKMKNKCAQYGIPYYETSPCYASSQICSNCDKRYNIGDARLFVCPHCGSIMDRDLNAACTIAKFPERYIKSDCIESKNRLLNGLQVHACDFLPPQPVYMPAEIQHYLYNYLPCRSMVNIVDNSSHLRDMVNVVDNAQSRFMAYEVIAKPVDNSKPRQMAVKVK